MKLNTLEDVFVHQLKDVYSAEKQIIEALPKMAEAASAIELRSAFEDHLTKSQTHLELVGQILNDLDINPSSTKCEGMAGLLKEGDETAQSAGSGPAKDAMLISAAQRVEHYEMAAYGSLRTYAKLLGYDKEVERLQHILNQEGEADKKLTQLAEGDLFEQGINEEAMVAM